eukprot:Clim_evm127s157 gene=Clim_evmTU127s157
MTPKEKGTETGNGPLIAETTQERRGSLPTENVISKDVKRVMEEKDVETRLSMLSTGSQQSSSSGGNTILPGNRPASAKHRKLLRRLSNPPPLSTREGVRDVHPASQDEDSEGSHTLTRTLSMPAGMTEEEEELPRRRSAVFDFIGSTAKKPANLVVKGFDRLVNAEYFPELTPRAADIEQAPKLIIRDSKGKERLISRENVINLRDAGGQEATLPDGTSTKIPYGKLFRSANLDSCSPGDVEFFLNEIGLKTHLDLRNVDEVERAEGSKALYEDFRISEAKSLPKPKNTPKSYFRVYGNKHGDRRRFLTPLLGPRYYHRGVWGAMNGSQRMKLINIALKEKISNRKHGESGKAKTSHYVCTTVLSKRTLDVEYSVVLECGKTNMARSLAIMADPSNHPVLISCAHGKDRTGLVTAMALHILGASKEIIARDYALSTTGLVTWLPAMHKQFLQMGLTDNWVSSEYDTMVSVFDKLERNYGSVDKYLDSIGINNVIRNKFRKAFYGNIV